MSKQTFMTASMQVFGQLIRAGKFKKSPIKSGTGEAVYVNENAEFIIVVRRIASSYGEPLIKYYFSNMINHRLTSTTGTGYYLIKLDKLRLIHRVVAATFFGNIEDGYEVNHINEDKSNNNLSNLEIVTRSENMKKYWENHKGNITKNYFGRYMPDKNVFIAKDGSRVKMTLPEYIEMIKYTRGSKAAARIARKYI